MNWKKVGKVVLFPHMAVLLVLLPVATAALVYSMVCLDPKSVLTYLSYVLSAYTLTVWCFRVPYLIVFFRTFKRENRYARRWQDDDRLRINLSLWGTMIWNTVYALFQLGLGIYQHSFWFYSLAGYYIFLAGMRFFLARYTRAYLPGEKMRKEWQKYRICGWIFLAMNLTITAMLFFMLYWDKTFVHGEIVTISMAAYTFTSFTFAIVNMVRYRKYRSPVYSASKAISLASASVSLLTLESTMLTTFGKDTMSALEQKWLLGLSGGAISVFVVTMAVYMIVHSTEKIKKMRYGGE